MFFVFSETYLNWASRFETHSYMGNMGILAAKVGVKHGSGEKWGFDRTCSEESMILIMGRLEFNPQTMEIQRTKSNMHLDWHPKITMIHGEPQIPTRMKLGNTWREHMGVYPLVSNQFVIAFNGHGENR